jgi:hypothetical protein
LKEVRKTLKLPATLAIFVLACSSFFVGNAVAQKHVARPAVDAPIEYRNSQYGFCFTLPASWKGYSIVTDQWNGTPLDGGPAMSGVKLLIRHPAWTAENPREDIPIMIFDPAGWARVETEEVALSAAPIGPVKLGKNRRYVFALPARWDFDELPGGEEADQVVAGKPLKAPCGK